MTSDLRDLPDDEIGFIAHEQAELLDLFEELVDEFNEEMDRTLGSGGEPGLFGRVLDK